MKTSRRKFRRSIKIEIIKLALLLAGITLPLLYAGSFFARLSRPF